MFINMLVAVIFALVIIAVEFSSGTGMECGIEASEKLVHHNPWTVYLEYFDNNRLMTTRCGGTLIDSRHVITAAHCIKNTAFDTLRIRLGEYDLDEKQECVEGVCTDRVKVIRVESMVVHPGFNGHGVHDIAILRMESEAPFTEFIRPACLPTGTLKEDVTFIAAGWGIDPRIGSYSQIKKIIPLPYFKAEQCQRMYGHKLPESVICAGGEEGIDTCSGDSGGPLMWMKGKAELWGITSIGNIRCGMKGMPAIYTRVADYVDWIREEISKISNV